MINKKDLQIILYILLIISLLFSLYSRFGFMEVHADTGYYSNTSFTTFRFYGSGQHETVKLYECVFDDEIPSSNVTFPGNVLETNINNLNVGIEAYLTSPFYIKPNEKYLVTFGFLNTNKGNLSFNNEVVFNQYKDKLQASWSIDSFTKVIYEPVSVQFGGTYFAYARGEKNCTSRSILYATFVFDSNDIIDTTDYINYLDFKILGLTASPYTFGVSNTGAITKIDNDTTQQQILEESKKQTQQLEEQNKKLDELNNNITNSDTSGANSTAGGFFNDFDNDDYGLSDFITSPLNFIKSLSSTTCNSLSLPMPFVNTNLELPCMTSIYQQYFGGFFTLYQTITFGLVAYWVGINTFRMIKDFKDPDSDKIEVMDL